MRDGQRIRRLPRNYFRLLSYAVGHEILGGEDGQRYAAGVTTVELPGPHQRFAKLSTRVTVPSPTRSTGCTGFHVGF